MPRLRRRLRRKAPVPMRLLSGDAAGEVMAASGCKVRYLGFRWYRREKVPTVRTERGGGWARLPLGARPFTFATKSAQLCRDGFRGGWRRLNNSCRRADLPFAIPASADHNAALPHVLGHYGLSEH